MALAPRAKKLFEKLYRAFPPRRKQAAPARFMGYRFKDPTLLKIAFTHKSRRGKAGDNQRLEFLGDAALSLAVSHLLMERHPDSDEGFLTKTRSALVSGASLSETAKVIGLENSLRAGGVQLKKNPRLLADALEAALGAVYWDGGFGPVKKIAARLFNQKIRRGVPWTDYKSAFQEWCQKNRQSYPVYRLKNITGPEHRKVFSVELMVEDKVFAEGEAVKKKSAEQSAAKSALEKLNIPV